jgi:cell division protein FtsL
MNRVISGFTLDTRAVRKQNAFTKLDLLHKQVLVKLLFLVIFIMPLVLFYTWSRVQIVQMNYEINRNKQDQLRLLDENKRLLTEVAVLKTPERLRAFAQERLGMDVPNPSNIVALNPPPATPVANHE